MERLFGSIRISTRAASCVSTGKWTPMRKGVSMSANLSNLAGVADNQRRVSSSIQTTSGAHTEPRERQLDSFGFVCAAYTTDGETTGLISVLTEFATTVPPMHPKHLESLDLYLVSQLSQWLKPCHCIEPDLVSLVNVSGKVSYRIKRSDVNVIVQLVRNLRRTCCISPYVSIFLTETALCITLRAGQFTRAIGVQQGNINPFDSDVVTSCLSSSTVEYISPEEQHTLANIIPYLGAVIPPSEIEPSTNIELNETTLGGVGFNNQTFISSSQGARASYRLQQSKQDITAIPKKDYGAPSTMQLLHSHRPLVNTKASIERPLTFKHLPIGTPAIVAFIPLPDVQEDAIIMNKSSLDFGMFRISIDRNYSSTCTSSLTSSMFT